MFTAELVSFSFDACVSSSAPLRVNGLSLPLRKDIASKVEIFTWLSIEIKPELRIFVGAAVVMTQYIVEIVILPTVIFLAKTPHLFLEQISQPTDKRLKYVFLMLRVRQ